jgi:hypothetical protein
MSYYETGTSSRLSTNSFLYKPSWVPGTNTTTITMTPALRQSPYMGEVTGGSPYQCAASGLPGVPHIPSLGNQFHGVGDTLRPPDWDKDYVDTCTICGTRVQNHYNFKSWKWEGWRPTATVPPKYIIEEEPF